MQGCLAGATECARNSATFVGASLLAIALGLTSVDVNVMAPSPAGSLPQWSMSLVHAQVQLIDHSRPVGIFAQLFFQERRLLRVPEIGVDQFLVVSQWGMAGDEIVDGFVAGVQAEMVEQAFQIVGGRIHLHLLAG